ncbi:MAG: lysine transporter LysE [Bacillota bacterium]|nr:MAG: lysine transporter LysE [Bacillota bacterium]
MTLGALFLTSLVIGFSGAVTPGPLFLACVTRTARNGFRGGSLVTVGHALLELGAVLALTLGVGVLLSRPEVPAGISLVGGLVLVWMGYGTARSAVRGNISLPTGEHTGAGGKDQQAGPARGDRRWDPRESGADVVTGMAATVSGPYWMVWWATVGLSYMTLAAPLGAAGTGAFYLGHISADFVWYSAVAAAVAGGRRLLTTRGYRILVGACGFGLAGLGALFATRGLVALAALV